MILQKIFETNSLEMDFDVGEANYSALSYRDYKFQR
jgi:hypothetical protein